MQNCPRKDSGNLEMSESEFRTSKTVCGTLKKCE